MYVQPLARLIAVAGAVLALAACGSSPHLNDAPANKNVSLVYGYIDMDEAPSKLQRVTMKKLKPKSDTPYYHFWVVDGMFFRSNVPPGTYKFTEFGGFSGWKNVDYTYNFPSQGRGALDPVIRRPGAYYVGSYKYEKIKKESFFGQDKYDLAPVKSPNEKELLQKMLPYAKHPHWKGVIEKRLSKLR
ncbi:MAG: hypothetical protein AMS22_08520 [Thiotrichales bacterium SG8_50]|nr:MAG: hypothetical protein AMS22_08520 [Thiotrichales bacterium SG8_50]